MVTALIHRGFGANSAAAGSRPFRACLLIGSVLTGLAIAAAMLSADAAARAFYDNLHWTLAHLTAAVLSWLGVASATADDRPTRRWFALGLSVYALGQLVWDLEAALGSTRFPAFSDAFFLVLAPCCVLGLISALRLKSGGVERQALWLDTGICSVAVTMLTLALYLPRQGEASDLQLVVAAAYPVFWLTVAALGGVIVLTERLRLKPRVIGFQVAVLAHGLLWMRWNALALAGELESGSALHAAFSVVGLALGASAARWTFEVDPAAAWDRTCEFILRQIPLPAVLAVAASAVYVLNADGVRSSVLNATLAGTMIVVILAAFRQTLLLADRDQLKAARAALLEHQWALAVLNTELEERVAARNRELSDANQELRQTVQHLGELQQQLIEQEKMAALGALVAGISHEINTPIGIAVTAASHLQDAIGDAVKSLNAGTLRRSDLERLARELHESADMVLRNLRRADGLIRDFKQVAVDQSSEALRQIRIGEYLREAAHTLSPGLRTQGHRIELHLDTELELETYPGAVFQVLTNLVQNSVIHGFAGRKDGCISVHVHRNDDWVVIDYRDDGAGMSEDTRRRIFEPFFTTRRNSGGSGLGMNIVFNLASQRLGGDIACLRAELGAQFRWRIPKCAKVGPDLAADASGVVV